MTKVNEIVIDALEDLIVQADEAPVEPSEARAAIRVLNDLMFDWDAKGISIGWTQVSDMGDVVTVPPGAIRGIKKNLSIELAPKYEVTPTMKLENSAADGYDTCVDLAVQLATMEYPPTLPRGSGNSYPGYDSETFYPDLENTILTESGGSVALEQETEESS